MRKILQNNYLYEISEPLSGQQELGKDKIWLDAPLKIACTLRVTITELMQE